MTTGETGPDISASYLYFLNLFLFLKLSSKATFSKNVKPITIAGQDDGFPPKSCLVSGWGGKKNSKYNSNVLREVNVTLIDNEMCKSHNFYCSEGETGPGEVSIISQDNMDKQALINNDKSIHC